MPRVAVVMAGGSGERFWPLSTPARPKQLLKLTSPDRTMLQEALERAESLVGVGKVTIASTKEVANAIREGAGGVRVLSEPAKRNTLGALVWTSAHLIVGAGDEWRNLSVAVLTADHRIGDPAKFEATARVALGIAERTGGLTTIGIRADRPETGFGYVEADRDQPVPGHQIPAYRAKAFHEKPDLATAEQYLASGAHHWNSGMFFWTLGAFHDALARAQPAIAASLDSITAAIRSKDFQTAEASFLELPSLPVDVALMERADRVYVVEGDFGWDDMGSWDALSRSLPQDEAGNVLLGKATLLDCNRSVIVNEGREVSVSVLGVDDLVVVVTDREVLVIPKNRAQEVKRLVQTDAQ